MTFTQIKALKAGSPQRKQAIRLFLAVREDFRSRVAKRAGKSAPLVSMVLHGRANSESVEKAIFVEEKRSA